MIAIMKSWQRTLYLLELKKTRDYPVGVTLSASMSVLPSFSDQSKKKIFFKFGCIHLLKNNIID